jgi:hypothetical protein
MRRQVGLVMGVMLAASAYGWAGDATAEDEGATEQREQRRTIETRVAKDPYAISSYYRSSQGSPFYGDPYAYDYESEGEERYPIAGFYRQDRRSGRYPIAGFYRNEGDGRYPLAGYYRNEGRGGRYPLAAFYRNEGGGKYSPFWNTRQGRRLFGGRYRRVAARDLCLAAPVVLFPFVPLVDVR